MFETLEIYLGSAYVNDFNLLGRTFQVRAQADARFRQDPAALEGLKTRSDSGAMVPIGSVATFEERAGAYRIPRYNLYPAGRGAGRRGARRVDRHRAGPDGADRGRDPARRLWLRMDRGGAAGAAGRHQRVLLVFAASAVFVFLAAGRAVRELDRCRCR